MSRTAVIIPCYNEAARLDVAAFRAFVDRADGVDLLFVNDGSTDGTEGVLKSLSGTAPGRMRVLTLELNVGKAEAVRRGIVEALRSDPAHVGFWDADLATPLDDIGVFRGILDSRAGLHAVFGSRVNLLGREVRRNLVRHYFGRVFATAAAVVLGLGVYDTQCGAKLFRASAEVRRAFADRFVSRWIFDVEILARLARDFNGGRGPALRDVVYEHPLMVWRDVAGSKLRMRHFLIVGVDLARIAMRYRRR